MDKQELKDKLTVVVGGFDFKTALVCLLIGIALGGWGIREYFPRVVPQEVTIKQADFKPSLIAKALKISLPIAQEIVTEAAKEPPARKAMEQYDRVIRIPAEVPAQTPGEPQQPIQVIEKRIGIDFDRPIELGGILTNRGYIVQAGYAPNKDLSYKVLYGNIDGKQLYGVGATIRWKGFVP